jgi:hypothetical protein
MATDYSQVYPYNVIPQAKSLNREPEKLTCLKCPADTELQAVIFENNQLTVVKGHEYKSNIEIRDVFIPAKEYMEYELILKPQSDTSTIINYGNLTNVDFIVIVPVYHNTGLENQSFWNINFRFVGDTQWKKLSRIFMMSTTKDSPIQQIELQNKQLDEITLRILVAVGYF